MISRIRGTLTERDLDRVEVMTAGGVGYDISIPRTVYSRLPGAGEEIELQTFQVVREDAVLLFGFVESVEREVFSRLLTASGVGPRLALAMLSAMPADRLVRAIRERDVVALTAVSGVGKKTAEKLAVELSSRFDDLMVPAEPGLASAAGLEEARRALTVLGFSTPDADRAVRAALRERGDLGTEELVRVALQHLS